MIPDASKFTVQIDLQGTIASEGSQTYTTMTNFRYRRNTGAPIFDKLDIALRFEIALVTEFAALLNHTYALDLIRVRCMEDPTDPFLDVVPAGAPVVGAILGDRMPPDNVAYILKRTGFRGKHYRGGQWLSPMSELDTTAGTADLFNAAALTRLNAYAAKIDDNFTDTAGNVWTPIIAQMSLIDDSTIPWIIPFSPITSAVPKKSVSRLKTRTPRRVY
jgi:hypothetical protein